MLTSEEWQEYEDYLNELTDEEFEIEMQWLESIGRAKQRGSVITSVENYTIQ